MEKIIVYLDDAEFARQQLAPMKTAHGQHGGGTHWILVACPPRMARYVNKWVNHTARQAWRSKWADKLFAQITPSLQAQGDQISRVLADGPLIEQTRALQQIHGAIRVLDARRPKFGQDLPPVTADQPTGNTARWALPGAVLGMGAALVLAAE